MKSHIDIVFLADTHGLHRDVDIPAGDLLIHAGDFTMFSDSLAAIEDFNDWLGELSHAAKCVIPGNHESFLAADPDRRSLISNATVLINEGVQIDGLRIWGSPMTPLFGGAFGVPAPAARRRIWETIPEVDVLITHGPPHGILDRTPGQPDHVGDRELLSTARRINPLIHAFGHVHGTHGSIADGNTTFLNCALLGKDGDIENKPVVLRIPRRVCTSES